MIGECENTAIIENRIELSDVRDAFGMPRARVIYKPTPEGEALTREVEEEGVAITRAAGAKEAWLGRTVSHHVLGGTVMGDDPARSVTNGFGQTTRSTTSS